MFVNLQLDEVKLADRSFAHRQELVRRYIADFDVNRLLHTFRIRAGIPSQAEPLGGWESEECGLRGHFVGHFLSACAKFAFADKDDRLRDKAFEIVDILEQCAEPSGYLSAFEEEQLDTLEREENRGVWAPYYTLHKIMQGLVDCRLYLNNAKALSLAVRLGRYIYRRFEKLSFCKIDGILRCTKVNPVNEFGGIGDTLYTLYEVTGEAELLELAQLFDREYFIDALASGKDVLDNLHANTHLPMVIAALHRYRIGGEEKYREAARHFYSYLRGRTFANGNSSSKATAYIEGGVSEKSEHWGGFGKLGDALTGGESESCCAHNTERIVEMMLRRSGDIEYLDHMESLKFNAVLNSASDRTGLSQYHQPMGGGAVKKFSEPYDSFWCCTASGVEAMSELQKNIWFKGEDAILLNAFISSTAVWKEKNAVLELTTAFPDTPTARLGIQIGEPAELKLLFKEKSVKAIRINSVTAKPERDNGFLVIRRLFRDGDTIDIDIDARLSLVPLPGADEGVAAVKYGSILLARVGRQELPPGILSRNIEERLVRLPTDKLAFAAAEDESRQSRWIPLYRVEDEEYSVYADWTGQSSPASRFSSAKDGRSAYINE